MAPPQKAAQFDAICRCCGRWGKIVGTLFVDVGETCSSKNQLGVGGKRGSLFFLDKQTPRTPDPNLLFPKLECQTLIAFVATLTSRNDLTT